MLFSTEIHFFPLLILLFALIALVVLLLFKLRKLKYKHALYKLASNASIGGYYLWTSKKNKEELSPQLISILELHRPEVSFKNIAEIFQDDKSTLTSKFNELKNGKIETSHMHLKAYCNSKEKDIQVVGYTIEDNKTRQMQAVILWFFDVSEYTSRIETLSIQNDTLGKEVKEYSKIFNSIPIPIWKRGKDFKIQFCNLVYSNFVKSENDNLQNNEIAELDQSLRDLSTIARNKNRPLNMKKHMIVQGERRFYNITETSLRSTNETMGFAYDITDQDEIEKELARHISAHSDFLESSSSAVAVYGQDTRLKFYNNAFVNLWGLKIKWLDTHPTYGEILELLREKRLLPEQADFKSFRKEQVMLFQDLTKTHEDMMHLPNGKSIRIITIPHALGGLLFAYEDVTDRLAMEASFNNLIAVQRETLDNLSEGVLLISEGGKIKLYNPVYQKMWLEDEEYLDTNPRFKDLLERAKSFYDYGNNWKEFKKSLLLGILRRKYSVRREALTNNHTIDIISRPLPNGDTLVSFVDVTPSILIEKTLIERNEALLGADKLKTEFLATISYQLRTPLTSIVGFSEALQSKMFGTLTSKQMKYIDGIYDASSELLVLINDVLDLASIEAGYMALDRKEVDVYNILQNMEKLFSEKAKNAKIDLSISCSKKIGFIEADESRIKQIIAKLLSNSIKFTKKSGEIILGAQGIKGDKVKIWVQDTGIGIAKNEKDKVFERFFKSAAAKLSKKPGAGLGLSVVKNIVELHGGTVSLESKEGHGTKITIELKRKSTKLKAIK